MTYSKLPGVYYSETVTTLASDTSLDEVLTFIVQTSTAISSIDDKLTLYGGLNENNTFNIEKFKLNEVAKIYKYHNPICSCGKRMKSAGKDKGYKCPKCGNKERNVQKSKEIISRDIQEGFYEVPTEARRHLSKPIVRMKLS